MFSFFFLQIAPNKQRVVSLMQYDVLKFRYKLRKGKLLESFEAGMRSGLNRIRIYLISGFENNLVILVPQ
jgi:hypothetical protein